MMQMHHNNHEKNRTAKLHGEHAQSRGQPGAKAVQRQGLNGLVLATLRGKLATRIEEAEIKEGNGHVLIEEEDYRKLRQAFEKIEGFTKSDMELVQRVLEAEEIDVEAIDPEGGARSQKEKKAVKGRR
jgi:hypothetical protein